MLFLNNRKHVVEELFLDRIRVNDSCFHFPPDFLKEDGNRKKLIDLSLDVLSTLSPLVVYKDEQHETHLIHGFNRVSWLERNGVEKTDCVILDEKTPVANIAKYILAIRYPFILSSAASRAVFYAFLKKIGVDEQVLINDFLPCLGLDSHEKVLKRSLRIASMPDKVIEFCHSKGFSFKKCVNFSGYDRELIKKVFELKDVMSFSASVLEEILGNMRDFSRMSGSGYAEILERTEIIELLNQDLSPSEKSAAFRQVLKKLRYPLLTEINSRISDITANMNLPNNVNITWDNSLENREVVIHLSVRNDRTFLAGTDAVSDPVTVDGIKRILNQL